MKAENKGSALYWLNKTENWTAEDWEKYNEYYRELFNISKEDWKKLDEQKTD